MSGSDLHESPPGSELAGSQKAALKILERRLENFQKRDDKLRANTSAIERIDAYVDLMLENAALGGKPEPFDWEIGFASDLASADVFSDHPSPYKLSASLPKR